MPEKIKINAWDRYWRLVLTWKEKFERRGKRNDNIRYVECICDCGNIVRKLFRSLRDGRTKSCWCLLKEQAAITVTKRNKTHWDASTRFYIIRKQINRRCNCPVDKDYKNYWWRGIKNLRIEYQSFKDDMYEDYLEHCHKFWEKDTTIDRIDVNWNYCKENCRWATKEEQARNRRWLYKIIYNWVEICLSEYCERHGVPYELVRKRLKKWWSFDAAIKFPKIPHWYTRKTFIK